MELTEFEQQTALWQKIEKELKGKLGILRERNDGSYDMLETATLRGQIRAIKEVLSWAQKNPQL